MVKKYNWSDKLQCAKSRYEKAYNVSMNKNWLSLFLLTITIVISSGCGDPKPTESSLGLPESPLSALPTPTTATTDAKASRVVPFQLDKPLREGDTQVTGTGPAGVSVRLEDVTFTGRFIAAGRIKDDGTFEIALPNPLEARHRVGLTLVAPWTLEDFQSPGFNGDEALMVPQVGFYYDTAIVKE